MIISSQPHSGNRHLDLFVWAGSHLSVPLSFPGCRISNRFGLPPRRSELIAELAGFRGARS